MRQLAKTVKPTYVRPKMLTKTYTTDLANLLYSVASHTAEYRIFIYYRFYLKFGATLGATDY